MSADRRGALRLFALLAVVAVLAATRLPGADPTSTVLGAASAGLLAVVAVAVTVWRKAPRSLHGWVFLLALATILVPPSPQAAVPWLPGWIPALAFVLALHGFFPSGRLAAPHIGGHVGGLRSRVLRFLPAVLLLAGLLALPVALVLLPPRIHATYELHTALAPLVPLVFIGTALVVGGALRGLLARGPQEAEARASHQAEDGVEAA